MPADQGRRGKAGPRRAAAERVDADRHRQYRRDREVEDRGDAAVGVVVLRLGQRGEQPGQEERAGEGVAEARLAEQQHGAEPEPAGDPDGADQVPGSIQRLGPAEGPAQELRAGGEAVPEHADRPDGLVGAAPLAPLVDQERAEDEAEQRRAERQDDVEVHGAPPIGAVPQHAPCKVTRPASHECWVPEATGNSSWSNAFVGLGWVVELLPRVVRRPVRLVTMTHAGAIASGRTVRT